MVAMATYMTVLRVISHRGVHRAGGLGRGAGKIHRQCIGLASDGHLDAQRVVRYAVVVNVVHPVVDAFGNKGQPLPHLTIGAVENLGHGGTGRRGAVLLGQRLQRRLPARGAGPHGCQVAAQLLGLPHVQFDEPQQLLVQLAPRG